MTNAYENSDNRRWGCRFLPRRQPERDDVTHWGLSGPAILRLSSYAARLLHDVEYKTPISVNWVGLPIDDIGSALTEIATLHPQKRITALVPCRLTQRLWTYLVEKALATKAAARWCDMGKKDFNRLANAVANDLIITTGRAPFHDEFVTCGGVSLKSVNPSSLESKVRPRLYFAGEVLDIDGVTGGFNFQAAWTTAYVVAQSVAQSAKTDSQR